MNWIRFAACLSAAAMLMPAQSSRRSDKELQSAYATWINQDVAYIITDAERTAFSRLQTDDEREQFVEQFWLRRDPTPDTVENEYKEEHYRRFAYVNERYGSGQPGWKTDRGRIYIVFGPPDEIESHPSGGTYQRSPREGGGTTTAYPFELWRYRFIEGIGNDVQIEFVDSSMSGEYKMAMNATEKDALQHVPGSAAQRAANPAPDSMQFDRLQQFAVLQQAPKVRFRDLEAIVTASVRYNMLPMTVRAAYMRMTESLVLTPVTIQFESRDLEFKDGAAKVNLYLQVSTLARRVVTVQEDVLQVTSSASASIYQKKLMLAPGTYRLSVAAKDLNSGTTSAQDQVITVPRFTPGKLATSSIILADQLESVPANQTGNGAFVVGDSKVRPRLSASFGREEKLGIYFQVYEMGPLGTLRYEVTKKGSATMALDFTEVPAANRIAKILKLETFEAGEYALRISVRDRGETVVASADFTVR